MCVRQGAHLQVLHGRAGGALRLRSLLLILPLFSARRGAERAPISFQFGPCASRVTLLLALTPLTTSCAVSLLAPTQAHRTILATQAAPIELSLEPLRALLIDAHATNEPFVRAERSEVARREAGWTVASGKLGATFTVNVTNTGTVDADDVVLGFLTPPGAGQNGVPLKQLFGFERVHVPAGKSVSVFLYPALTDFAAASATTGKLSARPGEYRVSFGVQQTVAAGGSSRPGRCGRCKHYRAICNQGPVPARNCRETVNFALQTPASVRIRGAGP